MTSAIQPVLSKVGLLGSNIAKTGEDVTNFVNWVNNYINDGIQAINGIGFL